MRNCRVWDRKKHLGGEGLCEFTVFWFCILRNATCTPQVWNTHPFCWSKKQKHALYWRKLCSCNKKGTEMNKFQASMCLCGFWRNRLKDGVPNRNEVVWILCFITPYCKNNLRISEFRTQASVTKSPEESEEDSKNGESMVWWMWKESLCTKQILLTEELLGLHYGPSNP